MFYCWLKWKIDEGKHGLEEQLLKNIGIAIVY